MFFFSLVVTFCCEFVVDVELGGVVWVVEVVVAVVETAMLTKVVFVDVVCEFVLLTDFFMRFCC